MQKMQKMQKNVKCIFILLNCCKNHNLNIMSSHVPMHRPDICKYKLKCAIETLCEIAAYYMSPMSNIDKKYVLTTSIRIIQVHQIICEYGDMHHDKELPTRIALLSNKIVSEYSELFRPMSQTADEIYQIVYKIHEFMTFFF